MNMVYRAYLVVCIKFQLYNRQLVKAEWIYPKSPESCQTQISVQPLSGVCKNSSFFVVVLLIRRKYIVHKHALHSTYMCGSESIIIFWLTICSILNFSFQMVTELCIYHACNFSYCKCLFLQMVCFTFTLSNVKEHHQTIITSESEIKPVCSKTVFGHRINTNVFHYLYRCTQ